LESLNYFCYKLSTIRAGAVGFAHALGGNAVTPVSRRTLTDQVSEAMLEIITEEGLSPGDPMPPAGALARRFDVSIVVVREAVAQLAGRGVLSRRQGREPIVATPGTDLLADTLVRHARHDKISSHDFLLCRAALECEAASLAAARDDRKTRAQALEAPLARLARSKTARAITEGDLGLHLAIANLSGNRAVAVILTSLHDVIRRDISTRIRRPYEPSQADSLGHHEEIVKSIVDGDPRRARKAMASHFDVVLPGFLDEH
jgi:GntR family transcriptional regulator, transcriptional repressor for pyruvate dehydrogenase complex